MGGVVERLQSLCVHFGPVVGLVGVCGLPVDFWWPVNTWLRMGLLEAQDRATVSVAWPFSDLAFKSIK